MSQLSPEVVSLIQKLRVALCNLEVAANTLQYCYDNHPKNFAHSQQNLIEAAESAREVLIETNNLVDTLCKP